MFLLIVLKASSKTTPQLFLLWVFGSIRIWKGQTLTWGSSPTSPSFQMTLLGPSPLPKCILIWHPIVRLPPSSLVYKALFQDFCSSFLHYQHVFTDGSKSEKGAASAVYCFSSTPHQLSLCLPVDSSTYTAELSALVLALRLISGSDPSNFIVFSDSLSALEAVAGRNLHHPQLIEFFFNCTHASTMRNTI